MTKKPAWREMLSAIIVAVLLALFIRAFIVQAYQIPSGSMLNTLLVGDRLLVNKFLYGIKIPFTNKVIIDVGDPERGDIIVFAYPVEPDKDYIKRVIGIPGDKLEMRNKVLYRNGERVYEPYARLLGYRTRYDDFAPITVPAGHYFCMGDNRDNSVDSRDWGFVPRENIRGKAWRMYWSWGDGSRDASGSSGYPDDGPRWDRIGMLIE
ncbi:MAG: signal peptidase I [Deltaproteobacteria bacterium]|jgi:signal peptidase I|nr:signal peptidase I [Deltaproteobacteria bacterium]